jgi:elongation factor G
MLIEVAMEPARPQDRERLLELLAGLAPEGSRFGVKTDLESGQTILLGDSEDDLEVLINRAKELGYVRFNVGAPQVAYREILQMPATITYTHKRQIGGAGEFAGLTVQFEPLPRGFGFVFENKAFPLQISNNFSAVVERAIEARRHSGLLAGFPVIDFKATLLDCRYHELDSNEFTFSIAARGAFGELAKKNVLTVAEPVMRVEIVTPDDFLGGVIGDLNVRRGRVQSVSQCEGTQTINALVPLANMFGYVNTLRAMSQGRAKYQMKFSHYEPVPASEDDDPDFSPAIGMRA